ncbi:MAG: hypothetical protein INR68_13900 [Methylobacterium mesophilicum]|nr:hypothetical protein [Methylobacterium mesophilicum]
MDTFLNLAVLPFIVGIAVMTAGVVVHDTTKGWESAGGMAALSGAFQIWVLGFGAIMLAGGF